MRAIAMSTRPVVASLLGVKLTVTPPWRMKVPSWGAPRTRRIAGLYVTVSVSTDTRDALLIESGTGYGPPATRNSVPGVVTMICAGVAVGPPAVVGGVAGG